jgi:cyclopropane fatty-acyl-phospholipid synthase-like methyltransferase
MRGEIMDWLVVLNEVQDSMEPFAKQHYKTAYRMEEIYYWYHVAKWIIEDSQNADINNILDVGCGHGTLSVFSKMLYNCDVTCIDAINYMSQEMVQHFELNYELMDIEVNMDKIYHPKHYDRIIFTEVIEHLYFNPVPTMEKLHEILKDDGKLFLSTPDSVEWGYLNGFYSHVGQMPNPGDIDKPDFSTIDQHIYQYSRGELERVIQESGFYINKFSYCKIGNRARHLNYELIKKI